MVNSSHLEGQTVRRLGRISQSPWLVQRTVLQGSAASLFLRSSCFVLLLALAVGVKVVGRRKLVTHIDFDDQGATYA